MSPRVLFFLFLLAQRAGQPGRKKGAKRWGFRLEAGRSVVGDALGLGGHGGQSGAGCRQPAPEGREAKARETEKDDDDASQDAKGSAGLGLPWEEEFVFPALSWEYPVDGRMAGGKMWVDSLTDSQQSQPAKPASGLASLEPKQAAGSQSGRQGHWKGRNSFLAD